MSQADNPASAVPSRGPRISLIRTVRRMVIAFLAIVVGALVLLTYFQRNLIYGPHVTPKVAASDFGMRRKPIDVTVRSHDGLSLHGWLVPAESAAGINAADSRQALADQRPVVLYFPGNAGHRGYRSGQLLCLQSLNVHTLLVDYRGYGDNPGHPTEADFARDARSAWDVLTEQFGVVPSRIVIYGESLGGGVATRLASELCQAGIIPGGLIAQSTFDSLVTAAQFHFPYLPVSWLLIDRFPSAVRIAQVTCPILSIHGTDDSIVPFSSGQRLFDAAPAVSVNGIPKRMVVLHHSDHNDVYGGSDHALLMLELDRFFEELTTDENAVRASEP